MEEEEPQPNKEQQTTNDSQEGESGTNTEIVPEKEEPAQDCGPG